MNVAIDNLKKKSYRTVIDFYINVLSEHKVTSLYIYTIFLAFLNFVRMFDNSVWGDEGIVVVQSRLSFDLLLNAIASSGHSPFHYVVAWVFVKLFGESGFVFHLSASLPYFIILLLSTTIIKRFFGIKTAILFVTFSSLLKCAIIYNLEIRMYAWCSLFCLVCYLLTNRIYFTKQFKYYALLGVFASLAAYTHYFALASVGLIYCLILGKLFLEFKFSHFLEYAKITISSGLFLVLFIPWILYVKEVKQGVITDYHIGSISWSSCFQFIFYSSPKFLSLVLFYLWLLIPIACYCKKFNLFKIINSKIDSDLIIKFNYKKLFYKFTLSNLNYWLLTGYVAVLGTITFSQVFSKLFFPITIHRYLYVSYIIAWLILAIELSSICKSKRLFVLILTAIFVLLSPYYVKTAYTEYKNNSLLSKTLEQTQPMITKNDLIYTDIVHFAWTVSESYYPNIPHNLFGHKEWWGPVSLPILDKSKNFYLFLSNPISDELKEYLKHQAREYEILVENGYIGTGAVYVYKVPSVN